MILIISLAVAPAIALFSYFYLRNDIPDEPHRTLFHTFLYGAILTFPLLFIQYVIGEEHVIQSSFIQNVLFSSTLEEFFKWFILIVTILQHVDFDDPYDGLLYGVSISLGYATVENILYLFTYGVDLALVRALLPVSSHAIFGVVMGYYIGKAKFAVHEHRKPLLFLALLIPISLHMMYNGILSLFTNWQYIMIPFMFFLWWFCLTRVKKAHKLAIQHVSEQQKIYE